MPHVRSLRSVYRTIIGCAASALVVFAANAAEPEVHSAVAGVFQAFEDHPLVGIGDAHDLAEEGLFYRQLVSDPRFSREIGNVVVEFGGASAQATLDRYLNGDPIPERELRRVWTDVVGWVPAPTSRMYQEFFEEVRAVNLKLQPKDRIRVWLGEPEINWTTIRERGDLEPYLAQRDTHAADLIDREVLSKGRKALVIYGGLHFNAFPGLPGGPPRLSLKELVERSHPQAFFIVQPYTGYWQPACSADFEAGLTGAAYSLLGPVRGSSLETRLTQPGCTVGPPLMPAPGAPPIPADVLTRLVEPMQRAMTGANADAVLYLGPAATLTRSPDDPAFLNDVKLASEISRRLKIQAGPQADLTRQIVLQSRPYSAR